MERREETSFFQRQLRAPLYEALERHAGSDPHPFHVPGHKMGRSFDRVGKARFQTLLPLDLTEISGLDDLHHADGVIEEAQMLAAEAFGAEQTRFLVGGSTVGNIALIMAVCKPGEKIIVQRNCHKSVYNGIILAQAEPVFLVPAVDLETGVAACLRREDVERALQAHPDAKAVFLTNPTYYGMGIDLEKMAATVHRHGVPLLVDEAHGAHYGLHPALPQSAMQAGADAAVQSTHKMGTAMTMSSMLHVQGTLLDRDRLYRILSMLQSSSPSYPLMASLDLARRYMVLEGAKALDRVLANVAHLRERLRQWTWLRLAEMTGNSVYTTLDPLKLLICLQTAQLNGYQLQTRLEEHGIYPELAELRHLLLVASYGTSQQDLDKLYQALESCLPMTESNPAVIFQTGVLTSDFLRVQLVPMHEAIERKKRFVPLEEAEDCICGEMVIPYPPGIPLLVPGERIDADVLSLLGELRKGGARFQGIHDSSLQMIGVLE
ncbi:aminotransferase class I/II-fold pyridoxal phosphate-dependent enzyme [Brevibacillus fulvus]|uniref:Arginine/lysine/ornithine decarboxylase n=1 Tax=Brevibacillus fulvus TaxID=1125967 RepID=A0A938Y199_9BACL|nr:aminotransferase class I/II-fold pyridoxal phosphate-dependent enzyme [Brevibacillus fulvus]MBM7592074.1 arginine/lysine/ornithine decarboxylase [Brevibacillus fulvus]